MAGQAERFAKLRLRRTETAVACGRAGRKEMCIIQKNVWEKRGPYHGKGEKRKH